MATSKQVTMAVLKRRQEVADLYLKGRPQWQIAIDLKVSQATVSLDLKAVQREWLTSAMRDLNAARARELAKWDRLETVAWEAWERSLGEGEVKSREVVKGRVGQAGDALPNLIKSSKRSIRGFGDPRYLETIARCIAERCRLLGLNLDKGTGQNAAPDGPDPWERLRQALQSGPTEAEVLEGHVVKQLPAPAPSQGIRGEGVNGVGPKHHPPVNEEES